MKLFIGQVSADAEIAPGSGLSARPGPDAVAGPLERALRGEAPRGGTAYAAEVEIDVPAAGAVLDAAGRPDMPDEAPGFSARGAWGRLEESGAALAEGRLSLAWCALVDGAPDSCRFRLDCAGHPWAADMASRPLSSLGVEWSAALTAETVRESWTAGGPVVFLPVERHSGALSAGRMLAAEDYHPFVRVADALERIFAESGFRLESEFVSSGWFRSLLVSGRYPRRDAEAARRRMDFRAARSADSSAAADASGTVRADPASHYSSVGAAFDTASADSDDAPDGVFDTGGCFRMRAGVPVFAAAGRATVAFEYDLRWSGTCRILSRERLEGFDSVTLAPGDVRRLRIPNPWEDMRGDWRPGTEYRALVFSPRGTGLYRVVCGSAELAVFSGRSALVPVPAGASGVMRLEWRASGSAAWGACADDWALYYGFVAEESECEMRAVLRGTPVELGAGGEFRFDGLRFSGARQGDRLTLRRGSSVRPVFSPHPGEGTLLTFGQVFSHAASRLDFVRAAAHLFDMRFYTDRLRGRVLAEPAERFYRAGPVVDMTGRTVPGSVARLEEPGAELPGRVRLCYRPGASPAGLSVGVSVGVSVGASAGGLSGGVLSGGERFDGGWNADMPSGGLPGELRSENPMLAAAAQVAGTVSGAPSARLVYVGGAEGDGPPDDLNFEPVAVRWLGMAALPDGQRWGWPSYGAEYPLAAFSWAGDGSRKSFTLSFGDSDGVPGLHTWYASTLRRAERARRLRTRLRLEPEEYGALAAPASAGADFRALWRLDAGGERGTYRLLEVGDYSPQERTAECVFIKNI